MPLSIEFGKKFKTIGFDLNSKRINELNKKIDRTGEVDDKEFDASTNIEFTNKKNDLEKVQIFIVTVPTPIDNNKKPNLDPLKSATSIIAEYLKVGDIVIYESTVYPGCTEEVCVPILEKISNLKYNKDFYCGYSPERINPGDKNNKLSNIKKVTSGSNEKIGREIDLLYSKIIKAGTYLVSSIKVAEAAKVIENSQRDINIAFVNELAKIFNLMDINTHDVLDAAGTKWNFLNFKPGLVGGHCIGVDPYYLAEKAMELGYNPEIILAGRRMNDSMGEYVASEVIKCMRTKNININGSSVLILGITFKENCPDIRNTKVVDLISSLNDYGVNITIYDPWANEEEVMKEYALESSNSLPKEKFDSIVLTVSHREFKDLDFSLLKKENAIIYDVKNSLNRSSKDKTL